jgi:hypothetical protein
MHTINEKENLENMKRCPRFNECSIPRCPLDLNMDLRTELQDELRCVLRKFEGKFRSKRMKGNMTPKMRSISKFIPRKI